jgi:hypothetical protein
VVHDIKLVKPMDMLNIEDLQRDLLFSIRNRGATEELLVEDLTAVVKAHLKEVCQKYEWALVEDITEELRNNVLGTVVRAKHVGIPEW